MGTYKHSRKSVYSNFFPTVLPHHECSCRWHRLLQRWLHKLTLREALAELLADRGQGLLGREGQLAAHVGRRELRHASQLRARHRQF